MVLYEPIRFIVELTDFPLWFAYLEQYLIGVDIANFEINKFDAIYVMLWLTEEVLSRLSEGSNSLYAWQLHSKIYKIIVSK